MKNPDENSSQKVCTRGDKVYQICKTQTSKASYNRRKSKTKDESLLEFLKKNDLKNNTKGETLPCSASDERASVSLIVSSLNNKSMHLRKPLNYLTL